MIGNVGLSNVGFRGVSYTTATGSTGTIKGDNEKDKYTLAGEGLGSTLSVSQNTSDRERFTSIHPIKIDTVDEGSELTLARLNDSVIKNAKKGVILTSKGIGQTTIESVGKNAVAYRLDKDVPVTIEEGSRCILKSGEALLVDMPERDDQFKVFWPQLRKHFQS